MKTILGTSVFIYVVNLITFNNNFRSLKENIIRSQPIDKQQTMAQWFDALMEGIERNISMKNRERFVLC